MKGRIRRSVTVIGAVTLAALLAVPGVALAKGGPPAGAGTGKGGGGGGGGGGGETTVSNSLSVPAIFVGTNPFGLTCDGVTLIAPSGEPQTGFPLDLAAYYYVQGVNKWQAQCLTATSATALAAWGDNLTGDAKLSVGSPIRVEIGLDAAAQGLTGYTVVKLDEQALDRVSPYGTLASPVGDGTFVANPEENYGETRVWTAGTTMTIVGPGANISQAATAEINATGRVVYGYNLRVTAAGVYTITFTFPNVTVTGSDAGDVVVTEGTSAVSLDITVAGGGGGGGGGGRK